MVYWQEEAMSPVAAVGKKVAGRKASFLHKNECKFEEEKQHD